MSKTKTTYPMGSVSSGTMRAEDLIPEFLSELRSHRPLSRAHRAVAREIEKRMSKRGYFAGEDADYDLQELFEVLDTYAGPYFYFGAHPGDGSDYGYWLSEMFDQDFEGLKVDDLAAVPADYQGELAVINDHGNVTLYNRRRGRLTEIWSVV